MAKIADIIKYEGDNSTFIWKHPCEDFNSLTQLIVHESQEAIFFMNGQALDLFGPGRHTLETQNIPGIGKALNRTTDGETPFHCQVYFINKTVKMAVKWGTDTRVRYIDPTYGVPLDIGASGEMNLMVSDGRKLLIKLVGSMDGIYWEHLDHPNKVETAGGRAYVPKGAAQSLQASFRPLISTAVKTNLTTCIKANNINILEIDESLEILSDKLKGAILPGFEEYGLTIPEFYVTTVSLPEDDNNFKTIRALHAVALKQREAEAAATLVAAKRQIEMEEETTKTEHARRAVERQLLQAEADAQAAKMAGFAEAEIMRAQGYTKRDEMQVEVQKAYAEGLGNMTITGGGGVAGDMIGLGVGVAAAGAMSGPIGEMFKGFTPDQPAAVAPKKINCPKCNSEVPENSKFCLECGAKIEVLNENEVICPACGTKTAKGKFCMECGAPLIAKCAKCGAELPKGAKFCLECGEKI